MKRFLKYLPTWSDVLAGLVIMMFGLLMISKGSIFIQSTPDAELMPISIPHNLPEVVAWLFVWYGFDVFVSGGKITFLIFDKLFKPVVDKVVKNIKGEKLKSEEEDDGS